MSAPHCQYFLLARVMSFRSAGSALISCVKPLAPGRLKVTTPSGCDSSMSAVFASSVGPIADQNK